MKKRKGILGIAGQLEIKAILSSTVYRGRTLTQEYYGHASSTNVAFDFKRMVRRAVLDCVYKHLHNGGKTSPQIQIIDYNIIYFDTIIKIKRENVKGKYYNVARNQNGKIISKRRFSTKSKDLNEIYENNDFESV